METTNNTLEKKATQLKKQRRSRMMASVVGIALLVWVLIEVICLFLDYKYTETSNDAQVEHQEDLFYRTSDCKKRRYAVGS